MPWATRWRSASPAANSTTSPRLSPRRGCDAEALLGDKGYDANSLFESLEVRSHQAGHPAKIESQGHARLRLRPLRRAQPHRAFLQFIKQFRGIATRYDKLLANFMGFVKLAAIAIWLK